MLLLAFPQRIAQTFTEMGYSHMDLAAQVSEEGLLTKTSLLSH